MNDHLAPAVTVKFVPILGGMELTFSSPNVRQPLTFSIPDTSRISLARQVLRDGLRELKSLVVSRFDGVRVVDEGLPDHMAATFSQRFYELFLLKGTPLGLAVNEARNHMLTESWNPLGLAYSVYGNTDLRIVNGVDSG